MAAICGIISWGLRTTCLGWVVSIFSSFPHLDEQLPVSRCLCQCCVRVVPDGLWLEDVVCNQGHSTW